MDRREFAKIGSGVLAAVSLAPRKVMAATAKSGKPNLLVIHTDEHNFRTLGTAQIKHVERTVADHLARELHTDRHLFVAAREAYTIAAKKASPRSCIFRDAYLRACVRMWGAHVGANV